MSELVRLILLFGFVTAIVAVVAIAVIQSGDRCFADRGYCQGITR